MNSSRARFELSLDQARAIAAAVEAVDGVAHLDGGRFGETTLLYPGARVPGLKRLDPRDDSALAVFVVVAAPELTTAPFLPALANGIRRAAHAQCAELERIDVRFIDVATPTAEPHRTS